MSSDLSPKIASRLRPYAPPRRRRFARGFWVLLGALLLAAVAPVIYRSWKKKQPRPSQPLSAVAVDAAGAHVPGAIVRFFGRDRVHTDPSFETTTDKSGRATLPADRAAGGFYCVGTNGDGIVSQAFVSQDDPRRVPQIEFRPAETIFGYVFDASGKPVADAAVDAVLAKGPPLEAVRTDRAGRFELKRIRSLPFLTIRVRHQGYTHEEREWDRLVGEPLEFDLLRTHTLRVQVLLPDGTPAAGLRVNVMGREDLGTTTDAGGLVAFEGVHPEARLFLSVPHEVFTYLNDGFTPRPAKQELRLVQPVRLVGRVLDFEGRGVAKVEVRHRHGPRAWVRTQADSRGRFTLGDLPQGRVELHYELPDGTIGTTYANLRQGTDRDGFVIRVK